jgi:hypothetical protein
MTVSISTLIAKAIAFIGPVVCASIDLSSPRVDQTGACPAVEWVIANAGETHVDTRMRVCCTWGSNDDCRYAAPGFNCMATEWHAGDAPETRDTIACTVEGISVDDIYLGEPACDAGDQFVCFEGDNIGAMPVCCDDQENCRRAAQCEQGEIVFCYAAPVWQ